MDIKTFELHESYDEAVEKFKLEGMREDKIKNRLLELNSKEFDELKGMNRAERRRWLKQNRKKAK